MFHQMPQRRQQKPWETQFWFASERQKVLHCKVYKIGVTEYCCDVIMPFYKI